MLEYLELNVSGLTLHLPTTWHQDGSNPRFLDNEDSNIYRNPGRSANKLHTQFTNKIGEDSLKHIQSAVYLGAEHHIHDGFKQRNTAVARESEYLIAFTWSEGDTPKKESGTYDTWRKHSGKKIHIPISSLSCVGGVHKSISSFFPKPKPKAAEENKLSSAESIDSGCSCSFSSASLQSSGPSEFSEPCEFSESCSSAPSGLPLSRKPCEFPQSSEPSGSEVSFLPREGELAAARVKSSGPSELPQASELPQSSEPSELRRSEEKAFAGVKRGPLNSEPSTIIKKPKLASSQC